MTAPGDTSPSARPPMRVVFLGGTLAPTIRLELSRDALVELCRAFARLARANIEQYVVSNGPEYSLSGLDALFLRLDESHRGATVARAAGPRAAFQWCNRRDGWWWCLSLAHALLRSGPGGHQYLSHEGIDAAIIEVSYGEPPVGGERR